MNQKGFGTILGIILVSVILSGIIFAGAALYKKGQQPAIQNETVSPKVGALPVESVQKVSPLPLSEKNLPAPQNLIPNNHSDTESPGIFYAFTDTEGLFHVETLVLGYRSIAKEFYNNHSDDYDFLIMVTNFSVDQLPYSYFFEIKNDVKGIGRGIFDNSSTYGSGGRLKSISFMNNAANRISLSLSGVSPQVYNLTDFVHELSHQWLMHLGYKTDCSTCDPNLRINRDSAHWSNYVDSSVKIGEKIYPDPNGGAIWRENPDGTFTNITNSGILSHAYETTDIKEYGFRFNTLDLYLMGLISPDQTLPVPLFIPSITFQSYPEKIPGTKKLITVDDLVKLGGQRDPAYPNTQKDFNVALILVNSNNQEVTDAQRASMGWYAKNLPTAWAIATDFKSNLYVK